MYKGTLAAALILGTNLLTAQSLAAQGNCAARETVVERLQGKYSERLKGGGLQNSDTLLEVWASETSGSFTVLITHANGISCVVSSGHNWNTVVSAASNETQS